MHAGTRGLGSGQVLGDLLGAERPARLDRLRPIGIGLRLGRRGLAFSKPGAGLGQRRLDIGQIGPHGLGREDGEHLSALDRGADVDAYFGNPQTIDLGPDRGLLPGVDAAVGRQRVGDLALLRPHGVDHQRRAGRRRGGSGRSLGRRSRAQRDSKQDRHCNIRCDIH